jgi:hypothetical protein
MHATSPSHLDLINRVILGEADKLWRSLLRGFPYPPVISFLLGPNILPASCTQTLLIHVLPVIWMTKF